MIYFNNYISPETMDAVMLVIKVFASIFVSFFLASLLKGTSRKKVKEKYANAKQKNYEKTQTSGEAIHAAQAMQDKLLAYGINYRCGKSFTPFDYMVLRIGLGLIGAVLSVFINPWLMPLAFILVFFVIPVYFREQNNNDNEEMMEDIGRMNSITALQIKNGVGIQTVIFECARSVENQRLRKALEEMLTQMSVSTVSQAARDFRKKFTNQYIDTYSRVLEQMEETGKSLEFFDSIAASVDRINEAIAIIEEQKAERVSSFFQLILFLGPVIIVFYILAGSISGTGLW